MKCLHHLEHIHDALCLATLHGTDEWTEHPTPAHCITVCVWKVFLTRRVAGNVSITPWVSENKIIDLFLYILLWRYQFVCDIHAVYKIISYSTCSYDSIKIMHTRIFICFLFFAGHQGSSQSDHRTITGFSSFKLPTCDWLQKGRSHSHTESSQVFWLRCVVHGFTRGLYMLLITSVFSGLFYCESALALQQKLGYLLVWVPHILL